MVRTLPTRWVPASTLWHDGATVDEIAHTYRVAPRVMVRIVKKLGATYPGAFPQRKAVVEQRVVVTRVRPLATLKERAVALLKPRPSSSAPFRRLRVS